MKKLFWLVPVMAGFLQAQSAPEPIQGFEHSPQLMALQTPPEPPEPPQPPAFLFNGPQGKAAGFGAFGKASYLGIGVAEVDAERAKALKLREERGVEVTKVEEDSPAAKAGLKQGDVVLEFNGQAVQGTEQFVRLVRETPPGRQVAMVVSRGGANQTLSATVGTRKMRPGPMDPGFQREISKMVQENLRGMRVQMPDVPTGFMSWRSRMLGIEAESLNAQLAEFFGVKDGVLVRSVTKDSPAQKAGLKAGDVIVRVGDQTVSSPREITKAIRDQNSKTFPLRVVRGKQEMAFQVTVEDRPERPSAPVSAQKVDSGH